MEFRILGPLEIASPGPVALGGVQQRALLALLVIRAGEVVPVDRLIDELWGERPPPTARKTVQTYVSQLRKALGPERLGTRGSGYVLDVSDDAIDARRFAAAVERGRAQLAAGDAEAAVTTLAAADGEWRGEPLPELTELGIAGAEVSRLSELRACAREDRLEAELALGRHEAAVAELEALCLEHPLRERPHGQLMLALYRSGRQADALEVYRRTRTRLVDELGLEPGPELQALERAILEQDPAIAPPPRVRTPAARRRRRWALVPAVAVAGAAAVAALGADGEGLLPPGPNTAVAVDPASLEVTRRVRVGDGPAAITAGVGGTWVLNGNDETVSLVDPASGTVARTVVPGATPLDIAIGSDAVWVIARGPVLVRIDPQTARVTQRLRLRIPSRLRTGAKVPGGWIAAVGREVWVSHEQWLWRVRPGRPSAVRRVALAPPGPLAVGSSVWGSAFARVERETLRVAERLRVGTAIADVAIGAAAVWIADAESRRVLRIDPDTGAVTRRADVDGDPVGLAVGAGAVWVATREGALVRLDRRTGAVSGRVKVGGTPRAVAVADGRVWVASA